MKTDYYLRVLILLSATILWACGESNDTVDQTSDTPAEILNDSTETDQGMTDTTFYYLALGDSYTIGESVEESERWPVILASTFNQENIPLENQKIIAKTGWTTSELNEGIDNAFNLKERYDLVSLLIGVNNQYRGLSLDSYKIEFENLLKRAILFAGNDASKVLVLSIPDYGVTPFAQNRNPEKIAEEIDAFNLAAQNICSQYGVSFYDITPISREAADDPSLIASDQLHPSGKMYARWVDLIYEDVKKQLF